MRATVHCGRLPVQTKERITVEHKGTSYGAELQREDQYRTFSYCACRYGIAEAERIAKRSGYSDAEISGWRDQYGTENG